MCLWQHRFFIVICLIGVISLLNTSTEGISGAVLFTVAEREAGRLRPSQVDLLLNPLFSMMKGNRRIQNGCQNAVAHVCLKI